MNAVDHTVRPQRQIISAVTHASRKFPQQLYVVKLLIAGRITQPIQSLRIVRVGIQIAERIEQSATLLQIVVDRFDGCRLAIG